MHDIYITVRNKIAVNPAQDRYVCGNSDYIVRFDFDAEWDEFETKTARFIKEDGTYRDQVFTGNECPMPVIENTYKIMVGVYAGKLSTTTAAYIPAKKSILCGGGSPAAPEDDVYNQIMHALNDAGNAADEADAKAENALAEIADAYGDGGGLFLVTAVSENGKYVSNRTQEEIRAAVQAGKTCILRDSDKNVCAYYGERTDWSNPSATAPCFLRPMEYVTGEGIKYRYAQIRPDRTVVLSGWGTNKTPNPKTLTFTGAVTGEYDGSKALTVNIPEGGSGGSGDLIVRTEFSANFNDAKNGSCTLDKTFDEILTAYNEGKRVICYAKVNEWDGKYNLAIHCTTAVLNGADQVQSILFGPCGLFHMMIMLFADGTAQWQLAQ